MLKDKRTIGLVFLVMIIWGIIGYKIYNQLTDDAVSGTRKLAPVKKEDHSFQENIQLMFSYADPFLKDVAVNKIESPREIQKVELQPRRIAVEAKTSLVIDWSLLKYYGVMSNASRAVKTGIVRFDNEDFFVREGDRVDIFTVLDVQADSIKLGCEKSVRYIRKQN